MGCDARIQRMLETSRRERRLAYTETEADRMAVSRRLARGELTSPYRSLFTSPAIWSSLTVTEQIEWTTRAIALRRPETVFAGPTAVALHHLEYQFDIQRPGIFTLVPDHGTPLAHLHDADATPFGRRQVRIAIPKERWSDVTVTARDGRHATTVTRTLVDAAVLEPFPNALAIWDSAERAGKLDRSAVLREAQQVRAAMPAVEQLLRYVDGRSMNGGESFTRAVMIEEGFPPPTLQRRFPNASCTRGYRDVDFCWELPNGVIIVGELDGAVKLTDPTMTRGRSTEEISHDVVERERQLYGWGVTTIFRLTMKEVFERQPMIAKMLAAGVPRLSAPVGSRLLVVDTELALLRNEM
ncbi:hypothetical protein [Bifidobacterium choloepi]|uniref:CTP synthase n=1 Tax=Bifidobacterium choloepi TaxID=2614131 RepID=A0A6I5MYZ3_9BIFI|nr:hypothetical protein [Bifidobacterium choloepi]NEG69858.1 hypothetical protein [Bifidobacterium choloepi]